jgi:hypothetical protein
MVQIIREGVMRTVRITASASGLALRPIDPFYPLPVSRLSPQVSALARLSALAAAAALISTFVVTGPSLEPSPALAAVQPLGLMGSHGSKDQARAPSMLAALDVSRFDRQVPVIASDLAVRLRPIAEVRGDWQEKEFASVSVIDGRTLGAGGLKIRLAGVQLPREDAICRTLDGRLETCLSRAATTLDVNTRWRRVSCRYQMQGFGHAVGSCRVGGADLAERVVRAGFARREGSAAVAEAN